MDVVNDELLSVENVEIPIKETMTRSDKDEFFEVLPRNEEVRRSTRN